MEAIVFLDRDNTLIANDGDLGNPDEVRLLEGVAGGLKALRAGYGLVVVSNQGGVARGVFTEADVDSVHQRVATLVDEEARAKNVIGRFYYCPYHPEAKLEEYRRDHPWRKPHPGMLRQAARDLDLDLSRCWMIGDQPRDIEAGRSAGCRTILLTRDAAVAKQARPTVAVRTFPEAVQAIIRDGTTPAASRSPAAAPRTPPSRGPADGAGASRPPKPRPDAERDRLHRSIEELTEVIRTDQQRRAEFTGIRLAAGMCQLLAVLLALLGLLQLGVTDVYMKWMIGAVLAQLLTIAILLLDLKA